MMHKWVIEPRRYLARRAFSCEVELSSVTWANLGASRAHGVLFGCPSAWVIFKV